MKEVQECKQGGGRQGVAGKAQNTKQNLSDTKITKTKKIHKKKAGPVSPQKSFPVGRPKRARFTNFKFPSEVESKHFAPNDLYMIQLLVTELKKHRSSKYLLLSEEDLEFTTTQFEQPYTNHITLNTIVNRMNLGEYLSPRQFYLDMMRMFKRNLKYLKEGQVRSNIVLLQYYYEELLHRHMIWTNTSEDSLSLRVKQDIRIIRNQKQNQKAPKKPSSGQNHKTMPPETYQKTSCIPVRKVLTSSRQVEIFLNNQSAKVQQLVQVTHPLIKAQNPTRSTTKRNKPKRTFISFTDSKSKIISPEKSPKKRNRFRNISEIKEQQSSQQDNSRKGSHH